MRSPNIVGLLRTCHDRPPSPVVAKTICCAEDALYGVSATPSAMQRPAAGQATAATSAERPVRRNATEENPSWRCPKAAATEAAEIITTRAAARSRSAGAATGRTRIVAHAATATPSRRASATEVIENGRIHAGRLDEATPMPKPISKPPTVKAGSTSGCATVIACTRPAPRPVGEVVRRCRQATAAAAPSRPARATSGSSEQRNRPRSRLRTSSCPTPGRNSCRAVPRAPATHETVLPMIANRAAVSRQSRTATTSVVSRPRDRYVTGTAAPARRRAADAAAAGCVTVADAPGEAPSSTGAVAPGSIRSGILNPGTTSELGRSAVGGTA